MMSPFVALLQPFWDFSQIKAEGQPSTMAQNWNSRGIFVISMKYLIDRYHNDNIWNFQFLPYTPKKFTGLVELAAVMATDKVSRKAA
jgi:hypothetical protein